MEGKKSTDEEKAVSYEEAKDTNELKFEIASKVREKAVKDTAKEILGDFYVWIGQDFDDIPDGGFIHIMKEDFKRRMNEFYKRYGVEVEL